MSDDLVKRLREVAEATGPNEARQVALDAAHRIEELEAKVAAYKDQNNRLFRRLREAWPDEVLKGDEDANDDDTTRDT